MRAMIRSADAPGTKRDAAPGRGRRLLTLSQRDPRHRVGYWTLVPLGLQRLVRSNGYRGLGVLTRGDTAIGDRGSGPGSRLLERATHDDETQRGDREYDVAIRDL